MKLLLIRNGDMKMKTITINGQSVQFAEFNTLGNAQSYADRAAKLHLVMLGDNDKFYVATGRMAGRLAKAGYEYA